MSHPLDSFVSAIPVQCPAVAGPACAGNIEQALYRAAQQLGFNGVRYTCWLQDTALAGGSQQSFSINFSNFPPEWEAVYEQQQYYRIDPVVRAIMAADSTALASGTWCEAWQQAEQAPLGPDSVAQAQYHAAIAGLLAHAGAFGIHSGVYMLVNTTVHTLILSLGSAEPAAQLAARADTALYQQVFALLSLCHQALQLTKGCERCNPCLRVEGGQAVKLTPMQLRILQSFASHSSATTADIARQHQVKPDTINFHLKAIREKLNKPNASGHALANVARAHGLI